MAYKIDFHFYGPKEFTNGWQLLWYGKYNQDEAIKQRTKLYKQLVLGLRNYMLADGYKPCKKHIHHYWMNPIYRDMMKPINDINEKLRQDNEEVKKYIEILKKEGTY